jgi:DNA-directed RNA polymerase sigma subunit (sigma70/sigma32)
MLEIHEVFTTLGRANKPEEKAKALLDNDSVGLRTLMRLNFDPTIKLNVNDEIEYEEAEEAKTTLHKETRNYASLTDERTSKDRNSNQFKDILESLDPREARILNAAKNKELKMRGLSRKLAVEVWGNRIFR